MLELAIPIKETFEKSTLAELVTWFSGLPDNAAWYVISDYCFEDKTKKNDVVSFSVLLNHDKLKSINEYINAFAPKDIKSTRSVSPAFLQYINSPVIFNFTFVLDRSSKLLRDYAGKDNMQSFLPHFHDFVRLIESSSSFESGFVESVLNRATQFHESFKVKSFNARLSRQIYLVATFASLIFHYLNKVKKPSHIAWVSDRDALVDKYDGFVYDLAYFLFLAECSQDASVKENAEKVSIDKPKFIFALPAKSGANEYDELIRIPDYLAGTLADLDLDANKFSKEKYYTVLNSSLVNSKNHAIIHLCGSRLDIWSRRLVYRL